MRRALIKFHPLLFHARPIPKPNSLTSTFGYFSSHNQNPNKLPNTTPSSTQTPTIDVEDISNQELKLRMDKYLQGNDEEALPSVFEALLTRRLKKVLNNEHGESDDDELMEELQLKPLDEPLDDVKDEEFDSGLEDLLETVKEIDDLGKNMVKR